MDERTSVLLIQALADVWSAIRRHHPEVPGVVLLAAPAHRGRLNVLGHFAALRWSATRKQGELLHEVVVVAEHMDRPTHEIVETLLHEAAHAMNFERGVKDCTASQYHNLKFKAAAEELGLEAKSVIHYGYAFTTLPDRTAARYATEIAALREVLIHRRKPVQLPRDPGADGKAGDAPADGDDEKPKSRLLKAVCSCPFIIRVAKATLDGTTIRCETCGAPFELT